jgi:hypothetical protein
MLALQLPYVVTAAAPGVLSNSMLLRSSTVQLVTNRH